jgi:hypothetical protein
MDDNTKSRLDDVKFIARRMAEESKDGQWLARYAFVSGVSFGLNWARNAVNDAAYDEAIRILNGKGDSE